MVQENFIETIENSLRNNWVLPAFTDYGTDKTMTYGQVAEQIAHLHLLFQACGIQKNDKIALIGKNNCNWVTTYLAVITYGAIIVPILQDFKPNDTLHIINHSDSKLLFVTELQWEGLDIEQMEHILAVFSLTTFEPLAVNGINRSKISAAAIHNDFISAYPMGFAADRVQYDPKGNEEVGSINYTSGTTGFSKGVITTLNALAGNVKFCGGLGIIYRKSRQVVFLPLAHSFGCAFDFLTSFCVGAHSYFIGRTPSPKVLLQAFAEIKPNCVFTVPLILEKIYKKQIQPILAKNSVSWVMKMPFVDELVLAKVRQQLMDAFGGEFCEVIIGGAPLNAEVDAFLQKIHFPYTVGYGMTECAPLISYASWDTYKPFSCGRPLEGLMEVKIGTPNADGNGEILVRGEHIMKGYYKNEEATREAFTADGWLRTGDLGMVDSEGNIFIKGRSKTMILGSNGQNIYPEEIEAKLNNLPYVMESLVIKQDDNLIALVCPDYEAADADHMTRVDLEKAMEENRKELNSQLAAYENIQTIRLYPHEFEKTPKKNIKRFLYTQIDK